MKKSVKQYFEKSASTARFSKSQLGRRIGAYLNAKDFIAACAAMGLKLKGNEPPNSLRGVARLVARQIRGVSESAARAAIWRLAVAARGNGSSDTTTNTVTPFRRIELALDKLDRRKSTKTKIMGLVNAHFGN